MKTISAHAFNAGLIILSSITYSCSTPVENEVQLPQATASNPPVKEVVVSDSRYDKPKQTIDIFVLMVNGSKGDISFDPGQYAYYLGESTSKENIEVVLDKEQCREMFKNDKIFKSKLDSTGYPSKLNEAIRITEYIQKGMIPRWGRFRRYYGKPQNYMEAQGIWPAPEFTESRFSTDTVVVYVDSQGRRVSLEEAMLENCQKLKFLLTGR
jgi:hypothetical protein